MAGFAVLAPNRIVPPRAVALMDADAFAWLLPAAAAALGAAFLSGRAAALACGAALAGLLAGLGATGAALAGGSTVARLGPAAGAWVAAAALLLAARLALGRAGAGAVARALAAAGFAAALAALLAAGLLDHVSLVREAVARGPEVRAALAAHLGLSAAALLPALAIGAALGAAAFARPGAAPAIIGGLAALQVIPAIALFALLIEPFAALSRAVPLLREVGLRGIGAAPAVFGVFLYLLLPVAAATRAALGAAPAAAVDAARGMGFTPAQALLRVRLPLGAPVFLGGVRTASVQAVGLVTLGALVGAGGFGVLMFQGLGQFAPDLILLGALPVAALALVLDAALRAAEEGLAR
ncbi:ABC transporter permease [Roseomonas sp. HF4]|uniref:ABC transporter permease n=1 Tax=Roseomonas sp. HF4 TaxID=2562313 RepID=UPI001F110CD8|nr:ABC transporter permease subunit [Roseomonas sp. HF4]